MFLSTLISLFLSLSLPAEMLSQRAVKSKTTSTALIFPGVKTFSVRPQTVWTLTRLLFMNIFVTACNVRNSISVTSSTFWHKEFLFSFQPNNPGNLICTGANQTHF